MARTWVVVAGSSAARIFAAPKPTGGLEEVESLVLPEGRMHPRQLASDLPGRAFDSVGGGRHALENEVDPREHAVNAFAHQLAERMAAARSQREVERLILVAAPEFLGKLRDSLDAPTRKLVESEFPLNLVKRSAAEIRRHLPRKLYSTLAR
jgi:protein required for attachment to host cells